MMAAAAALVGLSSCNDSSSGNGSEATNGVQPISTADFASGTKYYDGTIGGKHCSVQVSAASGATKSAQINNVPAGLVIEGAAVPFECTVSYRLEPDEQNATRGIMTFDFAGTTDNALRASSDFLEFWGIDKENSTSDLQTEVEYRVEVAFPSGDATAVASALSGTLSATPTAGKLHVVFSGGTSSDGSSDATTQP